MRVLALAAVMGAGLSFAGAAFADPYTDPNGRITFEAPRGWTVERQGSASQTAVLLFNASNDCYVFGAPNAVTAPASPDAVIRTTSQPLAATSWTATANSVRDFFPNNSAQLTSQTVDTSGFWPVQRAQFAGVGGKTVYAGMSSRPGFDLMAFCAPASGAGSASAYDALFNSLAHPNDATWQAAATQQAAQRQAQADANAAAAQTQQPSESQAQQEADGNVARSSRDPRTRRSRD